MCGNHFFQRGQPPYVQCPRPVRWLTPAEADALIETCAPHLKSLVIFLFYTGARLSEALYLDWRQVDLARQEVQFLETKNGDSRGVPLHPRVVAALTAFKHRQGAVFRRPNRASRAAARDGLVVTCIIDPAGAPYARKTDGGGQIKTGFQAAAVAPALATSRRMIVAIRGRRGTMRPTATSSLSWNLVDGRAKRWCCVMPM